MTIEQIIEWLKRQPQQVVTEFREGVDYYRWGEDLPSNCSVAFENGWRFARLQHSN